MVTQDPHLKEVFPEPPLIAYKHPPNLKSKLIRAKVPKANLRPNLATSPVMPVLLLRPQGLLNLLPPTC